MVRDINLDAFVKFGADAKSPSHGGLDLGRWVVKWEGLKKAQ